MKNQFISIICVVGSFLFFQCKKKSLQETSSSTVTSASGFSLDSNCMDLLKNRSGKLEPTGVKSKFSKCSFSYICVVVGGRMMSDILCSCGKQPHAVALSNEVFFDEKLFEQCLESVKAHPHTDDDYSALLKTHCPEWQGKASSLTPLQKQLLSLSAEPHAEVCAQLKK